MSWGNLGRGAMPSLAPARGAQACSITMRAMRILTSRCDHGAGVEVSGEMSVYQRAPMAVTLRTTVTSLLLAYQCVPLRQSSKH